MGYTGKRIIPLLETTADLPTIIAHINQLTQSLSLLQNSIQLVQDQDTTSDNDIHKEIKTLKRIIASEMLKRNKQPNQQPTTSSSE